MKRSSSVGMFYLWTFLVITALLVMTSCGTSQHCMRTVSWEDSIDNPENKEFVLEVAFNEGVETTEVTQEMFNERYGVE